MTRETILDPGGVSDLTADLICWSVLTALLSKFLGMLTMTWGLIGLWPAFWPLILLVLVLKTQWPWGFARRLYLALIGGCVSCAILLIYYH